VGYKETRGHGEATIMKVRVFGYNSSVQGKLGRTASTKPRSPGRIYKIRCRGITREEYFGLLTDIEGAFPNQDRLVLRNPLPKFDAVAVSFLTVLVPAGMYVGKKVIDILAEIVKGKVSKGEHSKTIIIYGPNDKPLKQIRK
jgi:hypothetical protein